MVQRASYKLGHPGHGHQFPQLGEGMKGLHLPAWGAPLQALQAAEASRIQRSGALLGRPPALPGSSSTCLRVLLAAPASALSFLLMCGVWRMGWSAPGSHLPCFLKVVLGE